jgi:hypothetical protein
MQKTGQSGATRRESLAFVKRRSVSATRYAKKERERLGQLGVIMVQIFTSRLSKIYLQCGFP